MAYIYRLIFDISVYYAVSGYYLAIFTDAKASAAGMVLLCCTVVAHRVTTMRYSEAKWRHLLLLLPVACLPFLTLDAAAHMLPAWGYASYVILAEKYNMEHRSFRRRFGKGLFLLVLLIPPLFNNPNATIALSDSALYILIQLISGVLCVRSLRDGADSFRQTLLVLAVTGICAVLTAFGVPQFLGQCFYTYVIQVLMKGLMLLGMLIAYVVIAALQWLMNLNGPPSGKVELNTSTGDMSNQLAAMGAGEIVAQDGQLLWLNIIGYILAAAVILFALVLLIRRIIKSARKRISEENRKGWSTERHRLRKMDATKKLPRRRPQDPRKAVRYYYALYMRECDKRGVKIHKDWTCTELRRKSKQVFPGEDPKALSQLYSSIRYCNREQVGGSHVKTAYKLWQKLKKTKSQFS